MSYTKEQVKEYQEKNKEKISKRMKLYNEKNKEKIANYKREYYIKNKDKINERNKKYDKNNKEKNLQRHRKYYICNKEKLTVRYKEYRLNNKEKIKEYRINNREKLNTYQKNRMKSYLIFKIKRNLRTRINRLLNGNTKSAKTIKLLGCSVEFLKNYLEQQFIEGMAWDNHSVHGWHIDHIKPCASFDLSKPEEQSKCFHYSNLQPLWAEDNLKKGSLYEN